MKFRRFFIILYLLNCKKFDSQALLSNPRSAKSQGEVEVYSVRMAGSVSAWPAIF